MDPADGFDCHWKDPAARVVMEDSVSEARSSSSFNSQLTKYYIILPSQLSVPSSKDLREAMSLSIASSNDSIPSRSDSEDEPDEHHLHHLHLLNPLPPSHNQR